MSNPKYNWTIAKRLQQVAKSKGTTGRARFHQLLNNYQALRSRMPDHLARITGGYKVSTPSRNKREGHMLIGLQNVGGKLWMSSKDMGRRRTGPA